MPDCEMCGYESHSLHTVIVEGSMLRVCDRCTTYGELVHVTSPKTSFADFAEKQTLPSVGDVIVEDYGTRIKSRREQRKLTQEELAKQAGITYSTLIKIESGANDNPTIKTMKKIADALDVSLDELVGRK